MDEKNIKELEKRILKKGIFIFMAIGIIVGGLSGVAAYTYSASQVTYTPKDTSWRVSNVSDAIDSLKLSKTSDNYSTEEKVVGTWIDGKPLYQKTIVTTSITQDLDLVDIDKAFLVLDASYIAYVHDSKQQYIPLTNVWSAGQKGSGVLINVQNQTVNVGFNILDDWANQPCIITLHYTKTTDQATN